MKVRDAIVAPEDHVIIELDYSQLETYCLAGLTDDETLVDELIAGADLHTENAKSWKKREEITPAERRAAKGMTFGLAYGETAYGMAYTKDLPKEECQEFIDAFYAKYEMVEAWHNGLAVQAEEQGEPSDIRVQSYPVKEWVMEMPYGKRYTFRQDVKTKKDRRGGERLDISFKPTYLKNYPVQGLASDLIRFALAKLWTSGRWRDLFKLCNTVHDSIIIMAHVDKAAEAARYVKIIMESAALEVYTQLGGRWPRAMGLRVDVEYGTKWSEMTGLEV